MPVLQPTLTLTPITGGVPITLPGPDEISRDQFGNVTFTWRDPISSWDTPSRITADGLAAFLSTGIDQKRNRLGTFLAVTDQGGGLQTVEWTEVDPWSGALLGPYSQIGVVALSSARSARDQDGLTLILYLAAYRYERGTGTLESAI